MANAILLNQSASITSDNVLGVLNNENIVSNITLNGDNLEITLLNGNSLEDVVIPITDIEEKIKANAQNINSNTQNISGNTAKINSNTQNITSLNQTVSSKMSKISGSNISDKIPYINASGELTPTTLDKSKIIKIKTNQSNETGYEYETSNNIS